MKETTCLLLHLALVLGVVALTGGPAVAQAPGVGLRTKADLWQGSPNLAKVSRQLLRARELARRGVGAPGIRARLPLVRLEENRVEVEVRLQEAGASVEQRLTAAGMEVAGVYPKYGRAVGRCPLERLDELVAIPEVAAVRPAYRPRTSAGSVTSQGDASVHSDAARAAFDVDGTGVRVGVLSDSFHSIIGGVTSDAVCTPSGDPVQLLSGSAPQASGDLPATVTVLDNCDAGGFCSVGRSDEGAALAEIIHDLAPGAEILFHTAFRSEADFADGISELVACGANVLVDDVIWSGEPMFQDGIIAQEVQAAVDGGVAYFSAAGNQAGFGADAAYLDASPGIDDTAFPTTGVDLHDFGTGNRFAAITIPPGCGVELVLQWNQPFEGTLGLGSANDLDLYFCRSDSGAQDTGGVLLGCDPDDPAAGALAESTEVQAGPVCSTVAGDPLEIASYTNSSDDPVTGYVAVEHYCGDQTGVRFRVATFATGGCSLATSGYVFEAGIFDQPQIYGHGAAAGASAVAAVFYGEIDSGGAEEPPFGGQIDVTPSSSLGGDLPFYFDGAGNPLAGAPVTRFKPDLAAPEGTNTSFFGTDIEYDPDSSPNIFGTSASAPHAAAVAALMLDRYPALSEPQIRAVLSSSATDIEAPGADPLSGDGLVDAHEALLQTPYSQLATNPAVIDFGSVEVGTSSSQELTLSNAGTADLHVASVSPSDPAVFSVSIGGANPCPSLTPTIAAPGGSCTIEVTYSPSAAQHDGVLTIESDSAVDPQIVSLTGTGFRDCASESHRTLSEPPQPISGTLTEEACISLTAGPYAIGPTGEVTFVAGEAILLQGLFSSTGSFAAVIDPLLLP